MTRVHDTDDVDAENGRRRHRVVLIAFVAIAFLACLALGWWQWTRFESAGGTGQNLGYALQWPLFAAFVIYAYRRFVQLEGDREGGSDAPAPARQKSTPREVPVGLLPERPKADDPELDPQMREYNRYLAELSSRDPNRSKQ